MNEMKDNAINHLGGFCENPVKYNDGIKWSMSVVVEKSR